MRLGAQLCDSQGGCSSTATSRARGCLQTMEPGGYHGRPGEIFAPVKPELGRIAMKFDLVSEGIDWFEACGFPDDDRRFWVR